MEFIKVENALKGKNSEVCKTLEYSFQDKNIDLGIATLSGRFPGEGYALNEISKELVYVINGSGTLVFQDRKIDFKVGDAILIQPGDKYYYETDFAVLSLICTPSWDPKQHKIVN